MIEPLICGMVIAECYPLRIARDSECRKSLRLKKAMIESAKSTQYFSKSNHFAGEAATSGQIDVADCQCYHRSLAG